MNNSANIGCMASSSLTIEAAAKADRPASGGRLI